MLNTISGMLSDGLVIAPSSYESIQTVTVGAGGSSTITFSSIPSTYSHLQIRGITRSTRAASTTDIYYRFNSDTGANYSHHRLRGNGASVSASAGTSTSFILSSTPAATTTSNVFSSPIVDILDYANTNKYKTLRMLDGYDANGSGEILFISGLWLNTSAITSITILGSADNLAQYSSFALYGIK